MNGGAGCALQRWQRHGDSAVLEIESLGDSRNAHGHGAHRYVAY